jgi:hypothetical protein
MCDTHRDLENERRQEEIRRSLAAEIVSLLPYDRAQAYDVLRVVLDILQMPAPLDGPPLPEVPAA